VSSLIKSIPAELNASNTEILAIVVDADENIEQRWREIKRKFEGVGYQLPEKPSPSGTIIEKQGIFPKIGIWLMPDNLKTGILEDFIREIIPQNDLLAPIANQTLDELEAKGLRLFRPIDRPKAFIHTWLAWQDEPGKPFGWAVTKRYFDLDATLAQSLVFWLKQVFDL
jgi:hypothetical protein